MSDNFLVGIFEAFVGVAFVLALLGLGQYIPFVTNIFSFFLVDHIQGMIAGAIVGAFLGSRGETGIEVWGFTISASAILGAIVQYLLFH